VVNIFPSIILTLFFFLNYIRNFIFSLFVHFRVLFPVPNIHFVCLWFCPSSFLSVFVSFSPTTLPVSVFEESFSLGSSFYNFFRFCFCFNSFSFSICFRFHLKILISCVCPWAKIRGLSGCNKFNLKLFKVCSLTIDILFNSDIRNYKKGKDIRGVPNTTV
jgi:hypothetical protein